MNRVNIFAVLRLNSCATLLRMVWLVPMGALPFETAADNRAYAITFNIEPTPEGENPSWDPDGSILTAHVQAAAAIWQNIFRGPEVYEFDYHWDDDIDGLGLTTNLGPLDVFMEINPNPPNFNWYADPTPNDNSEFDFSAQRVLFFDLPTADKSTYFPDAWPPEELEVRYRGLGSPSFPSASGIPLVNAQNGYDLLSTIVHEMGHVLGVVGDEPGNYNIDPQHIGGVEGVTVLEGSGGHLGGNGDVPGFLMCDSCGTPGRRRLPTATDALVIAEDQGLQFVFLPRVDRITNGAWETADQWIGGRVPDSTQDVFMTRFESVTVVASAAKARNLFVDSGISVSAIDVWPTSDLIVDGTLRVAGPTTLKIWSGASLTAGSLNLDPTALVTEAGTLVRFNDFTRGASSATSASFAGSVAIGSYSTNPVTFDPGSITAWNVAEHLTIGDTRDATLVVNDGTWTVGTYVQVGNSAGRLLIQGTGVVNIGSDLAVQGLDDKQSEVVIESGGTLNVAGTIFVSNYGQMKYQDSTMAANTTYEIVGGSTLVGQSPTYPYPYYFVHTPGGSLTFDGTATAAAATINIGGGKGVDAPSASAFFKGSSTAGGATIRNTGGRKGPASPLGSFKSGLGGHTTFQNNSRAGTATIRNEAVSEDYYGSGGRTTFADNSNADHATVENFGSSYQTYDAPSAGGVTEFTQTAGAGSGTFTNYPGGLSYNFAGGGFTIFRDQSSAENATLVNLSGNYDLQSSGETQFRDQSSAGNAKIFNRGSLTGHSHSIARFFDNATAASATITLNAENGGGGLTEFNGNSRAGNATFTVEGRSPSLGGWGGQVSFKGASSADHANFIVAPDVAYAAVRFDNQSTAGDATFVLQNRSNATLQFLANSSLGNAHFDIGSKGDLSISENAKAANADITIRTDGQCYVSGNSTPAGNPTVSLGASQIQVLGATASSNGGAFGGIFNLGFYSTAGQSTITVGGGFVSSARGGLLNVAGGQLGDATLVVNGGTPGYGGLASFYYGGNGVNARVIANAGGIVSITSPDNLYGATKIGSIEGAGRLEIGGETTLITGGRNSDTTFSGPIVIASGTGSTGGRLTKIGTGTLTLTGTNTYTGVTTVDGGTLSINGSNAGSAVVNSGGRLKGTGSVAGTVTVNSGGVFAPGFPTGTMAVSSLAMMSGSTLEIELGTTSDRLVVNANAALSGALSTSFLAGFTPAVGNSFDIFDWTSKTGSFSTLNLAALPSGLVWDTSQLYTTGVLRVADALAGDYSGNGAIDASDYVVWRKRLGTTYTLNDYSVWRAHFGQTAGVGSGVFAAVPDAVNSGNRFSVPEPANLMLFISCAAMSFVFRRRRVTRLIVVSFVMSPASTALAAYVVTDLGALGGTESLSWSINSSGQVTGYATTGDDTVNAFLWNPTTINAASGTMYDLGTLGGSYSWGTGLNVYGQVVGVSATAEDAAEHATLWNPTVPHGANGILHDLGTLGGPLSQANAANINGQVVGVSDTPEDGIAHAFLWNPTTANGTTGTMYDIGSLGGAFTIGWDINSSGEVIGDSDTFDNGASHAFLWQPNSAGGASGAIHDLGTLGGTDSGASAINDGGQVAGWSDVLGDEGAHAFLWTPSTPGSIIGSTLDLGTLGGINSYSRGLTTDGQVVGASDVEPELSNYSHAFVYTASGGMVDLNTLIDPLSGWELLDAVDINDAGQITGQGLLDDEYHAFLLTPVPILGDFNHDGNVDAADYVVWRNTGINGQPGYIDWRTRFGETAGSGSSTVANAVVPESATLMMLVLAAAGLYSDRHRPA